MCEDVLGEEFEQKRYHDTIVDYQVYEWRSVASLNLLNSGQNVIITLGLAAGSLLCGYLVSKGRLTVGDFVLYNVSLTCPVVNVSPDGLWLGLRCATVRAVELVWNILQDDSSKFNRLRLVSC